MLMNLYRTAAAEQKQAAKDGMAWWLSAAIFAMLDPRDRVIDIGEYL